MLAAPALAAGMVLLSEGALAQSSQAAGQNAASRQFTFNIPRQPLSSAMVAFQRVTGMSVLADGSVPPSVMSPGVEGSRSAASALQQMLAGTGLSYNISGNTARIINPTAGGAATVDGAIALDTIDVSGGSGAAAEEPYRTPGSSAYVSAEQLQRVPASSTGDIFKTTPGVISAGNRNGASIDVNIRGLQGANRVNVLVDGTQQTSSTYRGYGGHDNRVYVDPELLSGIEIEKGPTGGPQGAGFIGGVVNLRTLEAGDILRDGRGVGVRVNGSIGSNTVDPPAVNSTTVRKDGSDSLGFENRSGSFAAAAATQHVEIVAAMARRDAGNYFAGSNGPTTARMAGNNYSISAFKPGEEVLNTASETTSGLLKGKLKFLDGHSLELGYIYYDSKYGEAWPDLLRFGIKQQALPAHTTTHTYTARYAFKPVDQPLVDFHVDVWTNDGKTNLPPLVATIDTQTTGGEIWNLSRLSSPIGALSFKYGASIAREEGDSYEGVGGSAMEGTRTIGSVFNNAALDVTSWLRLAGSVRYDRYSIDGLGDNAVFSSNPLQAFSSDGSRVSPTASITITPWDGVQFFAQYANGWRPPTLREVIGITGSIKPNPNLDPETAENYEFGANTIHSSVLTSGDKLKTKLAYFDNSYDDYIVRAPAIVSGVTGVPYTWANIPQAHFKGIEGQVSYDAGVWFGEASLTYYTDVTYCYSDNFSPAVCRDQTPSVDYGSSFVPPKYSGSVTLGGRFFEQALTLGSRVTFAGARAADATVPSTTVPYLWAPYAIVDVFGSYRLTEEATINFSVENIADRYYVDAIGNSYMPAPGRTVRTGLTLRF
jgi:hemoglobin/transferrin/lactoferrin receptor protein